MTHRIFYHGIMEDSLRSGALPLGSVQQVTASFSRSVPFRRVSLRESHVFKGLSGGPLDSDSGLGIWLSWFESKPPSKNFLSPLENNVLEPQP